MTNNGHANMFRSYTLAVLKQFVQSQYAAILKTETPGAYWLWGESVLEFQKRKRAGAECVVDLVCDAFGCDEVRLKHALTIRDNHDNLDSLAGMTVREAWEHRRKPKAKSGSSGRSRRRHADGLPKVGSASPPTTQAGQSGPVAPPPTPAGQQIRVVDIFAGAGGLSWGFHTNGSFRVVAANEISPDMAQAYQLNYPDVAVCQRDIAEFDSMDVPGGADVLIGGPPCQAYSSLGRGRLAKRDDDDPRTYLFEQYFRLLRELDPQLFLFESVPGLLSMQEGKLFAEILFTV